MGLLLGGEPEPAAIVGLEQVTITGTRGYSVLTQGEMAPLVDVADVEVAPGLEPADAAPEVDLVAPVRLVGDPGPSYVRTRGLVGEAACVTEEGRVVEGLALVGTATLAR